LNIYQFTYLTCLLLALLDPLLILQTSPTEIRGFSDLIKAAGYQRVVSLDAGSNSVVVLVE